MISFVSQTKLNTGVYRWIPMYCVFTILMAASKPVQSKPLGTYIAGVSYKGTNAEISLIDAESLTSFPIVSADEGVQAFKSSFNLDRSLNISSFKPKTESSTNLYVTNLKKGTRTNISGDMVSGGNVDNFFPTAKNKYVFYLADKEVNGVEEIYRASTTNGKFIKMNATAVTNPNFAGFNDPPLPNGKGLFYRAKYNGESQFSLYLTMLKEAEPRRVSLDPPNAASSISGTWVHPKSRGVMYRRDAEIPNVPELYYYDIKTKEVHKVNNPVSSFTNIVSQFFDSKGKYVYYLADHEVDGKYELFRADLAGGEVTLINEPMQDDRSIGRDFFMDAKGKTLYYSCNKVSSTSRELYRMDLKSLESTRVTDEGVDIYASLVDQTGNIYYETRDEGSTISRVYKKDAKSGAVTPLLSPEIPDGSNISLQISADGNFAVLRTTQIVSGFTSYYFQNLTSGEVIDLSNAPYGLVSAFLTMGRYMTPSEGL